MPYFLWGQNKSWKQDCLPYNAVEIPTNHALHIYIYICTYIYTYIYIQYIYIYLFNLNFCLLLLGELFASPHSSPKLNQVSHSLWEIQLIAPSVAKKTEASWNSRFVALIFVEKHEFLRCWGLMSLTMFFCKVFKRKSGGFKSKVYFFGSLEKVSEQETHDLQTIKPLVWRRISRNLLDFGGIILSCCLITILLRVIRWSLGWWNPGSSKKKQTNHKWGLKNLPNHSPHFFRVKNYLPPKNHWKKTPPTSSPWCLNRKTQAAPKLHPGPFFGLLEGLAQKITQKTWVKGSSATTLVRFFFGTFSKSSKIIRI